MVGTKHIPPSSYVKLKNLNPFLPSQVIRKFYWENQEAKTSQEENSKKWTKSKKRRKLKQEAKFKRGKN